MVIKSYLKYEVPNILVMAVTTVNKTNNNLDTRSIPTLPYLISILLFFGGLLLLYLGSKEIINKTVMINVFRPLAIIFAPLLILSSYVFIVSKYLKTELEKDQNTVFFIKIGIIGGLLGIELSLVLNTRISDLVSLFITIIYFFDRSFSGSPKQTYYLIVASVFAPIFEETGKIIMLVFLSKSLVTSKITGKEKRAISIPSILIFLGLLTGILFILLETYLYTLLGTTRGIFEILNDKIWDIFLLQISYRTIFPLHAFTTILMSFGLVTSLYNSANTRIPPKKYSPFFITYIIALFYHSAANFFVIMASPKKSFPFNTVKVFSSYLPTMNLVLAAIGWIAIVYIIIQTKNIKIKYCPVCGNFHSPNLKYEDHIEKEAYKSRFFQNSIFRIFSKKENPDVCPGCGAPLKHENYCDVCGASMVYTCPQCQNVVSPYADKCWFCNVELIPPFQTTVKYKTTLIDMFSIQYMKFMLISNLFATFLLLIYIKQVLNSPYLLLIVSYLVIVTSIVYFAYGWYSSEEMRGLSIAIGRIMLLMFLLLITLFAQIIAAIVSIIIIVLTSSNSVLLFLFILFLIQLALFGVTLYMIVFDYYPILHPPYPLPQDVGET